MKARYVVSGIFLCVIFGFMLLAAYSYATDNATQSNKIIIKIDWEALYPFERSEVLRETEIPETLYERIKSECEDYTSSKLFGYYSVVESARRYDEAVNWNMASVFDYNAVVKLHDGYLTEFIESRDVTGNANSLVGLAGFCREHEIDFFYVNIPAKSCIYEDEGISGVLDYLNQNADRFLAILDDAGVKYYDFRKLLHEDGKKHHEAFYITDHHWKAETGLWGTRRLLRILRDDYGYDDVNPDVLDPERFDYVVYPEWFLGSRGKKVTISHTRADDFTMIYPKFKTNIHYEIPSKGINTDGDFSVTYDMSEVEPKDYYRKNPYAAYDHADQALIRLTNEGVNNDRRVLIVHASFGNCMIPFAAIGIRNVVSLDLRHFTGSLRSFIMRERPDMVIVAYNSEVPGTDAVPFAAYEAKRLYDFR